MEMHQDLPTPFTSGIIKEPKVDPIRLERNEGVWQPAKEGASSYEPPQKYI